MIFKKAFIGDPRTVKANKNTLLSAVIKGADVIVYLLLVPLTLGYLNPYEYGIWLTLNSMLTWINSFDIGLGNGLRNKLAIALAEDNKEKAQAYVSTTFFMLLIIIAMIYAFLAVAVNHIDWFRLLNISSQYTGNIVEVVQISLLFFCVNFVLKFVCNVYQALQLPAYSNLIVFSGNFLALIVIFVFTKLVQPGTLFWVAAIYSIAPPVAYLISYPITFKKLYPFLAPSFKLFTPRYLKDLLSISVVFFALQIASIILFALSNLLISNLFGPDQVTPYNIAYRYFSVVPMLFNLIITPMWSAATDAYARGDLKWIQSSQKRIQHSLIAFTALLAIMVLVAGFVYHIWIGDDVTIPVLLSTFMAVYVFILIWSLSYSYFLNGIGRLRLQMIFTIIAAASFYPVCHSLGLEYGIVGIVAGMCIINLPGAIVNTLQFNRVMKGKDKGIWAL